MKNMQLQTQSTRIPAAYNSACQKTCNDSLYAPPSYPCKGGSAHVVAHVPFVVGFRCFHDSPWAEQRDTGRLGQILSEVREEHLRCWHEGREKRDMPSCAIGTCYAGTCGSKNNVESTSIVCGVHASCMWSACKAGGAGTVNVDDM